MPPDKQCLSSDRIPPAVGPYSQAVRCGDLLFCSGVIPLDAATRKPVPGGIAEQARQALDNLSRLLEDCGSSLAQVVKTTVFMQNMEHFAEFNAIYAEYFPQAPPARSAVQVARLPLDVLIEVEAIAST
ncbi:RidA family protein [bacterium]|nr:RidA family protein [bacterium]